MDAPDEEEQLIYNAPGPSTFSYQPQQYGLGGGEAGQANYNDSEDEDSGMEFEEVGGTEDLADAPKQRVLEQPDGEEVEGQLRPAAADDDAASRKPTGPSEALEIVLEKAQIPELKAKKAARKPIIPGSDRKSRILIHNVNLLCLLVALRLRARLLFHDEELQVRHRPPFVYLDLATCRILSQVPASVMAPFQTARSFNTPLDRSRGFEAALQDLVSWWWRSFDVDPSIPGFQTITFGKALSTFPVPELPLDEDDSLTEKQKRKILSRIPGDHIRGAKSLSLRAVAMAGSKDISPQLFVSLCTALQVPARLVVSLQPLDWKSAGKLPADEGGGEEDLTAESQAESTATSTSKTKGKGKAKAKATTPKRKPKEASKLAKKVGLTGPLPSRFANRSKSSKSAPTTDDSDVEMEEVSIGAGSTPGTSSPGGFLAEQGDISEALRHAGPAPALRRSKPKLKDYEKSPSPDLQDQQIKPVVWAEVYNRSLKEWVTVDVTRKRIRCQSDMEPNKTDERNRMTYVVAIEQDGSIRDVTARYTKAFGAITLKNRPPTPRGEHEWWDRILSRFKRSRVLDRDREEERQMSRNQTQEAMPTNIAGFKDHPLFALERHLKREEAIHPQKQLGLIKDEAVYPRSSVVTVRSAEQWMREGLRVKEGEQPLKMVKSRAVTINKRRVHELAKSEGREEDTLQGLYARWQTVKSIPPPVVDGIVPRNGYGNLDLFAPHMLPRGGVHLPYKGISKVAKQLGIDFAEAITGFDFHKRRAVPKIDGIVVAVENEDVVMEAYWESEHVAVERAHNKKQEECLKRWKKLIAGLAIRNRLAAEYTTPSVSASTSAAGHEQPFVDQSRFNQDVEEDEAEQAARAAPTVRKEAKPAMLKLTHNAALPPSVQEAQQKKRQKRDAATSPSISSSSEAEQSDTEVKQEDGDEPETQRRATKSSRQRPTRQAAQPPKRQSARQQQQQQKNKKVKVLDGDSSEELTESDFEEEAYKPRASKRRKQAR